jgi:hypothetical protein
VAYKDGREEEFETGTAGLAEWELYALRHGYPVGEGMPPMLGLLVIAHAALAVEEGFEPWRARVLGVEMETVPLPPTLTEPMATS